MTGQTQARHLFIGSYNAETAEAIHYLSFDEETGILTKLSGFTGIENPSFLAFNAGTDRLYAVSEAESGDGAIIALRFDRASGKLEEINRQTSYGNSPCHLALDPSGRWLALVNYSGGPVSLYPIGEDGSVGPVSDRKIHNGRSVNEERQESSHPHSVYAVPGTSLYLVADLGTDTVYTYRLDGEAGRLIALQETKVQPGAGPRHLAFHPAEPFVYVIEELSSAITVYSLDKADGSLTSLQTVSTLPEEFEGESTCAEVALSADGRYLYGSNRGHDSIAAFRVGEDGRLQAIGHSSTGGQSPRHFLALPGGKWLLAAHQQSDAITVLRIGEDAIPRLTEQKYVMTKPVCIRLAD